MKETLLDLTCNLMAIPSVSDRREECHRALDWVLAQIGELGGLHLHHFEHQGFRSLILSTREGRRSKLILNAHLDVVFAAPEQFTARREGDCLWGRGAYDMKGAAAVFLQVARDLAAMAPESRPDVQIQFVTDEEIGGHRGSERLVEEGFTADLVIAGEPTDLGICYEAKGVYWVTVHMQGAPGHAAMPWLSRNPVVALQAGLSALLARYPVPYEETWATTATPTGLQAGNSHNRVPDQATLKLDIRHIPEESPDDIQAVLLQCFPGSRLEVVQRSYSLQTDPAHPLVEKVAHLQEEMLGQRPRFYREHFASDVRYWGNKGIPSICWGPSGAGMHADDERLDMDSLETYYRLVTRLLREF